MLPEAMHSFSSTYKPPLTTPNSVNSMKNNSPSPLDPPTQNNMTTKPGVSPQIPSFPSLFKENRNLAKCPSLDPNMVCDDKENIIATDDDILTIEDVFGHAFLGFVIGGVAYPKVVQSLIKSWNVSCTFSTHHNGWILFQFGTKEEMMKGLDNGPYSTMGRQWMIKEVPNYFSFKDSCFSSIPIWVNLRFLPKQCWSRVLLSKIAKKIGRPMAIDVVMGEKSKHEGARILVEVDLNKPIMEKVSITMPDGRIWDQIIEFEIKPVVCTNFKSLGHKMEDCKPREPKINVQGRGRSRARRERSSRPNMQKEKANVGEGESTKPNQASSILSASPSTSAPNERGKGKIQEVEEVTPMKDEVSKGWEMVLYKNPLTGSTRSEGLMELPLSHNTFGPLFDEDERTPLAKKGVEAEKTKGVAKQGAKEAKPIRVRPVIKEEDLRRSGRRKRGTSSSS